MTRRPIVAAALLAWALLTGVALAACSSGTATPAAQGTARSIAGSPAGTAPSAGTPGPGASGAAGVLPPPSPAASVRTPATGSGIAGITTIIAVCPVQRAESPCPSRPVPVKLSVVDTSNTVVASVTSNANGYFSVALKPGRYTLRPVSIAGGPPHPQMPTLLTVTAGHYTTVTLRYDTGMR